MSEEAPWENDPLVSSSSQRDVRLEDNAADEKASYSKMITGKSTRDKKLMMNVFFPAHELNKIERDDLTLSNLNELESEIKRTKDPKAKDVLVEEHKRMLTSFANILGIK